MSNVRLTSNDVDVVQLPRFVIAAVFIVIGALISIPFLPDNVNELPWWAKTLMVFVITPVLVTVISGELRKSKRPERDIEAERLRRAAGLPSARGDDESITRRQERELRKEIKNLEKTLVRIEKEKYEKGDAVKEIVTIKDELSSIRERLDKSQSREEPRSDDHRPGWATLVEVYIQATKHLGSSYRIGQSFAVAGGLLFLLGIGLALFRPHGNQTAAILAAIGGSITNVTSGVFFSQTNRAREYLERQAKSLREDILIREFVKQSEEVIAKVDDGARRDELRAQVVLRILGGANAELIAVDELPETRRPWTTRFRLPFRDHSRGSAIRE
ncbi:hypothetical protein GCM10023088_36950 [Actinomadura verrucosospora]|uniref:TRADD-N-associated membrane domain-containing protein n=1 Tax=Actinomadura verrucosospora TaxID=46165 RepID=UPI0031EBB3CE